MVIILWSRLGTPVREERYARPDRTGHYTETEYVYEAARRTSQARGGKPRILLYRRTEKLTGEIGPANLEAITQQIEQIRFVDVFLASCYDRDGLIVNPYDNPSDLERDFEKRVRSIIQLELQSQAVETGATSQADAARVPPLWQGSPFPGLRAFTPDDAPIFFGRGRETDGLIRKLADPASRFITVVGASGSGKSSLVAAGLIPRLKESGKDWVWVRFTPGEVGDDPFMALAVKLAEPPQKRGQRPRDLAAQLKSQTAAVEGLLESALAGRPESAELLLFVDQFEELFTLVHEPECTQFLNMILQAATIPRLRVVATLRADFYHCCLRPGLEELLAKGHYPLAAPGVAALFEMIDRPAAYAGLEFERDLVQQILNDTGIGPGNLALMAYLLDELYRACNQSGTGQLTHAAYTALGKVQGAIGMRAESTFRKLDPVAQAALPSVFRELVWIDDQGAATRMRRTLDSFTGDEPALLLIDAFVQNRLLVTGQSESQKPQVEIAHEALLQSWPRLRSWIETTRDDLRLLAQMRLAALQWADEGRKSEYLWTHDRAAKMVKMLSSLKPRLSAIEQAFARPEAEHLLDELDDRKTTHDRRAQIGDRLAELGDPRPGVGLGPDGLPDLAWCRVGPDSGTESSWSGRSSARAGKPTTDVAIEGASIVRVETFYIARYPVT